MDSFLTFMDIFSRCVEEQNSYDLTNILKDGRRYFQNLTTDDSQLVLHNLFNDSKGLLCFLKNELNSSVSRRGFDNAIKEGFLLIQFIIEQFDEMFEPYIIKVKEICELVLVMHCSVYIKKAACGTLNKIIMIFKEYDLFLGKLVIKFVSKFYQLSIRERSFMLSVLGTIARYHPEVKEIQSYKKVIFRQLLNDFKVQYKPSAAIQPNEIQIYLEVLTNMLGDIIALEDIEEKQYTELYKWIKSLSVADKNLPKRVTMRAAITLLSRHMTLFCKFVYNDYEFWYQLFIDLAKEKGDNSECGQRALKIYYKILEKMLEHNNSEKDKAIFLYFNDLLKKQITDPALDSNALRLVVYGFSKLAAPCQKYFGDDDVRNMYFLIARCIIPFYARENVEHTRFVNICDYQEALSKILCHISVVTIDQINGLIKISTLLIKRYPELPINYQNLAISSLIKTITNICSINKTLVEEFLYNVFHDGVIWSCSHTLLVDAELQRALHNLPECPICYKNYLPLWVELLNPDRYQLHGRMHIAQQAFDEMIYIFITLMNKLNLRTKMKENNILSDIALSQIAENEADFRIFINLTDLYVDIINKIQSFLLDNTINKLLYEIIKMSYKYPLISGFYKLVCAIIKSSDIFCNESYCNEEMLELLHKYLLSTLDQVCSFSNELLISCLYLVMCTPTMYIESVLLRTIPVFKIAFTTDVGDFDLAFEALNTLEKWICHIDKDDKKEFLSEIVPYLESFLQSKESSVELLQDIITSERKVIKHITLINSEKSLENLQKRILLFFGSLDSDVALNFIYKRALNTGATWDKKDLLKYMLPFPDIKSEIYFDKIFPRLITLAQSSGDRRTKVIACELLHAMVAFILGKTMQNIATNSDCYSILYKTLFPALLTLGCDSDEIVWKLFQPLLLQITHWLSSKFMLESPTTAFFIDVVFDSLSTDANSSLREFSGMCLAEFVEWSIKQSSETDKFYKNIHAIIRKIIGFGLHPSVRKRVAAAVAFNHLYKILREHEEIVSMYWLELFYCFIRSLEGCNDHSIHNALNHIDRVIQIKLSLLSDDNADRKKPLEFKTNTVNGAAVWLFTQCGSLDENCRIKCMEFYINLSNYIKSPDSSKSILESYIDECGIQTLNCVILNNLKATGNFISINNMMMLLRSFDCYIWLIKEKLINVNYLFTDLNPEKETIFHGMQNFSHLLLNVKIQTQNETMFISKALEELQTLQCKTMLRMLQFIQTLFNLNDNVIPEYLLNEELFELISNLIISPHLIGFDTKNIIITEELPRVLENVLNLMTQKLNNVSLNCFFQKISIHVTKYMTTYFDFNEIINNEVSLELRQYVKGLIMLKHCKILNQISKDFEDIENKLGVVFNSLIRNQTGCSTCVCFKTIMIEYLNNLMKLLLIDYQPSIIKVLVNLIENNTMLLGPDSVEITHGVYFLTMFKDTIFKYMLMDVEKTMIICDELLQTNPSFLLTILEQLLLFVKRYKQEFENTNVEMLVNAIVKRFIILERTVNNVKNRKQKLMSICGISVHLMHKPTNVISMSEDFYQWILKEFMKENVDIEYKTEILQNFLICLTDITCDNKPELVAILRTLRSDRLSISANICSEHSVDALKLINCFHTLLSLLPITKSLIVFETIIFFAAGANDFLFNEKVDEYLKKYFNSVPNEYALKSLQVVYQLFMDVNSLGDNVFNRLDVLKKFLLPVFQFCTTTVIERFFVQNIKEIYTILTHSFTGNNTDIAQLIVSKIGCYNLIEIMFAKIQLQRIHSIDNINETVTGTELVKQLYSNALHMRCLKTINTDHKEIMRLLHCSAYNCSIAIVSLKDNEEYYVGAFAENRKKGQLVWENIVDYDKEYKIKQTFKEYPKKRKTLINIRKNMKNIGNMHQVNYSYIFNYDLATSTLIDDLNAYDFNEAHILSKSDDRNKEENIFIELESVDFNNHECMPSICGILLHMQSNGISTLPNGSNIIMPKWLKCFYSSMCTEYNNVRMFMLQIILNTKTIFKPYAKFFIPPILHMINEYLRTHNINYIITDVLLMLLDWHTIALPNENCDKVLAQKVLERIIDKLLTDESRLSKTIYKYNINIIRMMVEIWQTCLQVPKNLNEKMITNTANFAINLILICLANNMHKEIISRNRVLELLLESLENWKTDMETILQSYEAFGLILKFIENDNDFIHNKSNITKKIQSVLRQMQMNFQNLQIKCIWALCKNYPNAAVEYLEFITANMFRVDPAGKANCLELVLLAIPKLTSEQIIKELNYMKFHSILQNKIVPCEKVCLQIIQILVEIIEPSELLLFAKLVSPYIKNDFLEYREIAYNIFMSIYIKYLQNTSNDENTKKLIYMSKEMLLIGVLDPSKDLQEKILTFWTENVNMTEKSIDQLIDILKLYSVNVEDVFLSFISLAMLNFAKKSVEYTNKLFNPLHDCTYQDYKIVTAWRAKNLGSMAPLFASSLANEMNQTFIQRSLSFQSSLYDSSYATTSQGYHGDLKLRATQEVEFEPTYTNDEFIHNNDEVFLENQRYTEVKSSSVFKLNDMKRPRRFLDSSSAITKIISQKEIKKNIRRTEMIREETVRQSSTVNLCRKYRFGDFPDIEITHSNLIEPLQELIKKDQLVCKDVTVGIICALVKTVNAQKKSDDFLNNIANILKSILQNSEGNTQIVAAILEVMITIQITDCCPDIVLKVCKISGLNFLGSLFLEESFIFEPQEVQSLVKKMKRGDIIDEQSYKWLQLASLYESMNETDIVLSIFQNKVHGTILQDSSFARAATDWMKGKILYEKAYEIEAEIVKDHCLQGLFECLSYMSCWNEIDERIQSRVNKNLNDIWDDPWKDWMLPWMFKAYIREMIDMENNDQIKESTDVIESWLKVDEKRNYMKHNFGEELAIFCTYHNGENACEFINAILNEIRDQWTRLDPLSVQLRNIKLQKLRGINDIDMFLKSCTNSLEDIPKLNKFWSNTLPSLQDDILVWDKLISYRKFFVKSLIEKLDTIVQNDTQNDEKSEIINNLHKTCLRLSLNVIDIALKQKNKFIANKYLSNIKKDFTDSLPHLKHYMLICAKIEYQAGEDELDIDNKLSRYISSWKYFHNVLQQDETGTEEINLDIDIDARQYISTIAVKLIQLTTENNQFANILNRNNIIFEEIRAECNNLNDIKDCLEFYSFKKLKECCDISTKIDKQCYYKLSKYCYERLSYSCENVQLFRDFVFSTLKAMSYGSFQAAHYFPCLLKPQYFDDRETEDIFVKNCNKIQTWLFLSWQAQLFSHLGTPIASLVIPIIERIIESYPAAVVYTFRLTVETNPALINDPRIFKIRKVLYAEPEIDKFLQAMQYVIQPELYLLHHLSELSKNLSHGVITAVNSLLEKVYSAVKKDKDVPKPGNIYNEITKYKSKIRQLEHIKSDQIPQYLQQLSKDIKKSLTKRRDKIWLKDYSPWLCELSGSNLEIPGQYVGNKKPMPQYHTKIMKIDSTVKVMQSMRKPIRITIIGNDAKDYNFLVKFGEDLRLDQRLQQLFSVMNKTLNTDTACRQRRLLIDIYQVIPLSRSLGLIQWVDDTRPLHDLIFFTHSKEQSKQYEVVDNHYVTWIRNAAPSKNPSDQYKEATLKYDASTVIIKMNELIAKTDQDSLRKTCMTVCPSLESFVTFRRNFITTYATMCIAHWILGIGDRHLGNILITIRSGKCLGIDFGLAFGAGVDLRVPELMPFRLTPQILGLLKPFSEKDLLKPTMVHVLRALRNKKGPILACLDVFIHEPLNWIEHINKNFENETADIKWLPQKKIEMVMRKLNGVKPSTIIVEQLKDQHHDQYFLRYSAIVNGNDDIKRVRGSIKNEYLTPEEQVDCLLDQATDLNILGRTYVGWKPWL